MEEEMELNYSWTEDVRWFYYRSASHRNFIFVQIRMMIDRWLDVVDVHVKADSMAAASS